jgi:hypothetical protein
LNVKHKGSNKDYNLCAHGTAEIQTVEPTDNQEAGDDFRCQKRQHLMDKTTKKLISVNRRDLWDRYWMTYDGYKEWLKEKRDSDTGGIRKARMGCPADYKRLRSRRRHL